MSLLTTTLPRVLGALFYYAPDSEQATQIIPGLGELESIFPWPDADKIQKLAQDLATSDPKALKYDFSTLFEGQGHMSAPPWGSVYLEQENLLMGDHTEYYYQFLAENGINTATEQREPDDQFGLMLMAFALLLERSQEEQAKLLLTDHLLPWAFRYLELVQQAETEYRFYPELASIACTYLETLKNELDLTVQPKRLYF